MIKGKRSQFDSIVSEYDERYEEAYYAWNPFFPLADDDLRFYLGIQWDEKERQKLFEEGRSTFVYNLVRRNINLITGYQIQNRLSSTVAPVEDADQKTADQLSKLLIHVMAGAEGYETLSKCFGGALKTGFNLMSIWMDYRDDPVNGDIKFGRVPYNGFITDPYFTQLDFSDCSFVIRRKYLSPKQTASLLPGMEKDVMELASYGWNRDDKFTWLPYQTQPSGLDFMAYNEYYEQGWESKTVIVDTETGEFAPWEGSEDGLKMYLKAFPQLEITKRQVQYVDTHIIVNDVHMKTVRNQFGLNEYPFVPLVGIFEPESEFWGEKMQSLIRCMKDPQREANRRRSQMVDIMDSQINSGWIAKKSSVINPRSLFQTSQGKVVWMEEGAQPGDIEKIPPSQVPQSMFELQRQFDQDIMNIAGISDASFGNSQSDQESGLLMQLRQSASLVNLQDLFDNLRFAQKQISRKALKLMQTWLPSKVKRIINEEPTQEFYDQQFLKYDVTVQEGVLTNNQRQLYFRQLMDLFQITSANGQGPITPQMLVQAAPMQGKSDLATQVAENAQMQAQQAQAANQQQAEVMNAQMQLAQASAVEKMAGAKERYTRSVANLGLEDERAAKAVDDRASAALDRTKAMAELAKLDDDRLVRYMSMVRMMEGMSERDEEEIKQEDVGITERAGEQPPQQDLSSDMGAFNQQQMGVDNGQIPPV